MMYGIVYTTTERREDEMDAINETLAMYEDACGCEAVATWDNDQRMQEKAVEAWNQYEGAKTVLAIMFGITEEQVDEDMETLMTCKLFG